MQRRIGHIVVFSLCTFCLCQSHCPGGSSTKVINSGQGTIKIGDYGRDDDCTWDFVRQNDFTTLSLDVVRVKLYYNVLGFVTCSASLSIAGYNIDCKSQKTLCKWFRTDNDFISCPELSKEFHDCSEYIVISSTKISVTFSPNWKASVHLGDSKKGFEIGYKFIECDQNITGNNNSQPSTLAKQSTLGHTFHVTPPPWTTRTSYNDSVTEFTAPSENATLDVPQLTTYKIIEDHTNVNADDATKTDQKYNQSANTGVIIPLVVGLCAVIIVAAMFLLLWRRRKKKGELNQQNDNMPQINNAVGNGYQQQSDTFSHREMVDNVIYETSVVGKRQDTSSEQIDGTALNADYAFPSSNQQSSSVVIESNGEFGLVDNILYGSTADIPFQNIESEYAMAEVTSDDVQSTYAVVYKASENKQI